MIKMNQFFKYKTFDEVYDVKYNKGKWEISPEGCIWTVKLDEYWGAMVYLERSLLLSSLGNSMTKKEVLEWGRKNNPCAF